MPEHGNNATPPCPAIAPGVEHIDPAAVARACPSSESLARIRALIREADPEVVEEWKWGIPVWSHGGIICTGETYKAAVKTTFAKGAALEDPSKLFNSSLEGNVRRAVDFPEGGKIDEKAFKALIRAAVALNTSTAAKAGPSRPRRKPKSA